GSNGGTGRPTRNGGSGRSVRTNGGARPGGGSHGRGGSNGGAGPGIRRVRETGPGRRRPPIQSRRLVVMFLVMAIVAVAVVARLMYVQGVSAGRYAAVGQAQLLHTVTVPALRGSVVDRNGEPLAMSV